MNVNIKIPNLKRINFVNLRNYLFVDFGWKGEDFRSMLIETDNNFNHQVVKASIRNWLV